SRYFTRSSAASGCRRGSGNAVSACWRLSGTIGRVRVRGLEVAAGAGLKRSTITEKAPNSSNATSAVPTARPMPKPKMARTLTSLDSCRTSGFSMCSAECSLCVVMVHFLLLHQLRPQVIAEREQRTRFQVIHEKSQPQAAHSHRHQQVHPQRLPGIVVALSG